MSETRSAERSQNRIVRSFRIDTEASEMVEELAARWHVSQGQVVEILAREAVREGRELRAVRTQS